MDTINCNGIPTKYTYIATKTCNKFPWINPSSHKTENKEKKMFVQYIKVNK